MDKKNKPEELRITPAAFVALKKNDIMNAIIASTPGGIERQEADGIDWMIQNTLLPRRLNLPKVRHRERCGRMTQEGMDYITEMTGIRFGEVIDELFVKATLPDGWSLSKIEGATRSCVIKDEEGRSRFKTFYKAAFYDRRAELSICSRFDISCVRDNKEVDLPWWSEESLRKSTHRAVIDRKTGKTLFVAPVNIDDYSGDEECYSYIYKLRESFGLEYAPNYLDYWNTGETK